MINCLVAVAAYNAGTPSFQELVQTLQSRAGSPHLGHTQPHDSSLVWPCSCLWPLSADASKETRSLLALVGRAAALFSPLAGSEALPGVSALPPGDFSDLSRQHAMILGKLTRQLAALGWLEQPDTVSHDAYSLGARIFGMLIAESGLPQLAMRRTGEFGPTAGQVSPSPPPPSASALLDRLSAPPCRSPEGLFEVTLLCDKDGTPLPRQSMRAAVQGQCGLSGPGVDATAALAIRLRVRHDTAIVGSEAGTIGQPPEVLVLAVDRLDCAVHITADRWMLLRELGVRHDGCRPAPGKCASRAPGYRLQTVFCRRGGTEYAVLCEADGQPMLIFGRGSGIESLGPCEAVATDGVAFV